jgi:hypothetical protein
VRLGWLTVSLAALSIHLLAEAPARLPGNGLVGVSRSTLAQSIPRRTVRDSAQIFSGTVLSVEHLGSNSSNTIPVTKIKFRVEVAIRGIGRRNTVEINEWAGLWQTGERYRPGERVLLFLYAPSRLGLTSPVGGRAGRYHIENAGYVVLKTDDSRRSNPIQVRRLATAIRRARRWVDSE